MEVKQGLNKDDKPRSLMWAIGIGWLSLALSLMALSIGPLVLVYDQVLFNWYTLLAWLDFIGLLGLPLGIVGLVVNRRVRSTRVKRLCVAAILLGTLALAMMLAYGVLLVS